jgi:hypothetical protein
MRALVWLWLLCPALVFGQSKSVAISSGVADEDLADTPTTDGINMQASQVSNQLSLTLTITPGTTTRVDVTCYDSDDGSAYAQIPLCDAESPSGCVPDVRRFTLASYTANASGDYVISSKWPAVKKWIKCSVDDPDDGNGTILITGSRSWQ